MITSHGGSAGKVLDVAYWKYEVGNDVNFVGHHTARSETFKSQRGTRETYGATHRDGARTSALLAVAA